jgi:hypothetical protein
MKSRVKLKVQKTSKKSIKDIRLWLGIIFILSSVFIAQTVIANATERSLAFVVIKSVPAGSKITSADLVLAKVVLPDIVIPLTNENEVVGKVAARDLFAGDLVVSKSIANLDQANLRLVSVPIRAGHLPDIQSGQLVDVWVTPSTDGMALPGPAQLVISQATVQSVPPGIDPTLDTAVTLLISTSAVQEIVQAMRDGVIDLVALPENRRGRQ